MQKCLFCNADIEQDAKICFECGSVQKKEQIQSNIPTISLSTMETFILPKEDNADNALNTISPPPSKFKMSDLSSNSFGSFGSSFSNSRSKSISNSSRITSSSNFSPSFDLDLSDPKTQGHLVFVGILLLIFFNTNLIIQYFSLSILFYPIGIIIAITARIKHIWLQRYSYLLLLIGFALGYFMSSYFGNFRYYDTMEIAGLPMVIGILTRRRHRPYMTINLSSPQVMYLDKDRAKKDVIILAVVSIGFLICIPISFIINCYYLFIISGVVFIIGLCYTLTSLSRNFKNKGNKNYP